jgi:hypothetical protein
MHARARHAYLPDLELSITQQLVVLHCTLLQLDVNAGRVEVDDVADAAGRELRAPLCKIVKLMTKTNTA